MLTEIACGPISRAQVLEEIPFIYGWACNADDDRLWIPCDIVTATPPEWIERSMREGIYEPGESDMFISDKDRLTAHLCHEGDIHIKTPVAAIVEKCALRWLGNGHRLLRSTEVPPSPRSWREIRSVDEAIADM
jgi:hypothetical protein